MKKLLLSAAAFLMFLGLSAQTFILEDFTTFLNDTTPPFPSGWKNIDSSATQGQQTWRFNDPGARNVPAPFSGRWATIDSDDYGPGNTQNTYLQSPNFNASSATQVILEFDHAHIDLNDTANVEVFDGTNWNVVARYNGVNHGNAFGPAPVHEVINISQWAAGVVNAQIRFHYIGTYAWYWAIDNINVYQPLPDDAAALSVDSLVSGCGLDSIEVKFTFINAGSTTITNVPVEYSVNGLNTVSEVYTQSILAGDTVRYTFNAKADVSTPGTYTITANTAFRGDANLANDTTSGTVTHFGAQSLSYTEDFDLLQAGQTGLLTNNWIIESPGSFEWRTNTGGTGSFATGPTGDNTTGSGIYLYTEASAPASPGEITTLTSTCLDFGSGTRNGITLEYYYHMYGVDILGLEVYLDSMGTWVLVDSIVGQQQTGNADPYLLRSVTLNNYTNLGSTAIRFQVERGASFNGDVAIDDVRLYEPTSTDVGVLSIDSPSNGCGLTGTETVCVSIKNFGTAAVSNFPVVVTLNNGTPVSETVSATILPGDTLNYCFTATLNLATAGTYQLASYTTATGDGDNNNDSSFTSVTNIPILTTYPYTEDFENGNGGWTAGGNNSTWALGTPSGLVINSAAAPGSNAWVTNLSGNYNDNDESFVLGPCFDFTNLAAPQIKMDVWWNSEFSWDGAVLQSSIDGGTSWQMVGSFGSPNNWYTDNSILGLANLEPSQEGWSGRASTGNGSGGWVLAEHDLSGLGGVSGVLLRVAFGSDGSVNDEGFAFDNVLIQNAPANDVEVLSLDNPKTGCGLGNNPITVCMVNKGSATINNFPISYSLNSAAAVTDTVRSAILPGDTACFTFTTPTNLSTPGTYNFVIYSSLAGDGNLLNDTIMEDVTHFGAVTIPSLEDFDALPSGISGTLPNNWIIESTGAFEWRTNNGATGSFATGPTGDNTSGAGIYLYTEASAPAAAGEVTTLTSTCLDFGSGTRSGITLEYYYHMYGADIIGLDVYLDSMGTWVLVDQIIGQQQLANADPYIQRQVSLNNFVNLGPTAVRFEVVRGASFNGDVAIDDVSIFEPSPDDVGVVELISPESECGLSATDTVEVAIYNFGTNVATNFPVNYSLNGAAAVTETFTDSIQPGDTGYHVFAATVNLSSPGTYLFDAYTTMSNDGFPLNDSIIDADVVNSLIMAPSITDFDNLLPGAFGSLANGWELTPTTGYRWQTNSGQTGSLNTGPNGDNTTGTGIYVYTEASSGAQFDSAYMTSPCVDIMTTIDPTIVFAYHMYGIDMGELHVQIDNGFGWITIDTIVGQKQISLTDPYLYDTLNINAFKNGNQVKFRFVGIRGSSFTADIAVDDIQLISLPVGLGESNLTENDLTVYPNPNNGEFSLTLPNSVEVSQIAILDIHGKVVDNVNISRQAKSVYNIDLSDHAKGVYMLRVNDINTVITKKVIIK